MSSRFLVGAIAFAATLAANSASAAYISFSENRSWTAGSHSYTNGTHSVDVSAANIAADGTILAGSNPLLASWIGGGLGICNGTESSGYRGRCKGDEHYVDGTGNREVAVLDFGSLYVQIDKVVFTHLDNNDNFSIYAYDNGFGAAPTALKKNQPLPDGKWQGASQDLAFGDGTKFAIGAWGSDDEFKIKKIKFTVLDGGTLSTVPLPAAGWGLLVALGGLGVMRRFRKS